MKHLTIEEVISRLEARDYTVKKSGGVYRSQCPAHDGKDLNLAFSEGNKGQGQREYLGNIDKPSGLAP